MIERDDPDLSIGQQCALLSIPRSSFYYSPQGETEQNLALMRLNRPGFAGERLVRMLGCFFIWVQGLIEHLLCFMRRDISDGAVKAFGVVPIYPFQRFPFKLAQ